MLKSILIAYLIKLDLHVAKLKPVAESATNNDRKKATTYRKKAKISIVA